MGQQKIILAFENMVGKFVGQSETDTERRAVVGDDIDAGDFRLFTAVESEARL